MADTELTALKQAERDAWDAYRDAPPDDNATRDAWGDAWDALALARRDG